MNKIGIITATAVAGLTLGASIHAQNRELGSTGQLIEGIAAIVDESVILRSELTFRLGVVLENLTAQQEAMPIEQRAPLPPTSVLEQQVLEQLIMKELQLQRAERIGIVVGDDILNEALGSIAESLGMTLEDLPNALAEQGIDYTLYRQDSREDIVLNQLEQRDVYGRISVSPRELEQCLTRSEAQETDEFDYNISHILIGVSGSATREELRDAQQRAEDIKRQLTDGADFGQLALTYSDGPTALEGGSLGWRKGSQLPTLFSDVVVAMKPGDVSDVIQSGSGFHLVRLNDMRGGERIMIDQVRARHILVSPNEILDDDATHQKAIGIYEQLLAGEDFATVALASSEDTVSAADGGDLGWTTSDSYVEEFAKVLESLAVGEMSEPFQTRFGWHIVEVTDRRSYDTTDDMKSRQCQREIRAGKAEEERQVWLQQLRDQAFVETRI